MSYHIDVNTEEYYVNALNKKPKSSDVNFENLLWDTLDLKPSIGNKFFLNVSLYNSCRFIVEKELSQADGEDQEGLGADAEDLEEKSIERETKIIELYQEKGGEIETFSAGNYQVPATIANIHQLTFEKKQYRFSVLVLTLELKWFPNPYGIPIFFPFIWPYISAGITYPRFTENYERIGGQIHTGNGFLIDTRCILRKKGKLYPKVSVIGDAITTSGTGAPIGVIPFLGGSMGILFISTNPNELVIGGFGLITPVILNDTYEYVPNQVNWSLAGEIKKYVDGDIKFEKLSLLAQKASLHIEAAEEAGEEEEEEGFGTLIEES